MKQYRTTNEGGFIILFTVLISVIILLIALGISNIAVREVQLSATAREGNRAFFAADTGAECALYHDQQGTLAAATLSCANQNVTVLATADANEFRFTLPLPALDGCVDVTVFKAFPTPDGTETRIESFGTNVSCDVAQAPQKVERAVRVTYPNPGE